MTSSLALKQPSFEDLVVAALPRVKAFAISLTKDITKAEDVTQETMLKALAHKNSFQQGTNIEAWLFTICKNTVFTNSRKRKEIEDPDGSREAFLADAGAVGEEAMGDEAEITHKLIRALPKPMRDAIEDVSEGLSYADAAKKRGLDVGTIKSRLSRAREALGVVADRKTKRRTRLHVVGGEAQKSPFRKIDTSVFQTPEFQTHLDERPRLMWLPITRLRIDETYQRKIQERGIANVYRISKNFDWRKFSAVVVAMIEQEGQEPLYAIVDGQHRSYAAALRGIDEVPCLVIKATRQEQAAAFEAINAKTTKVALQNIFAASVAAGDPEAVAICKACSEANVSICRYPQHEADMKPRETLAIGALRKVYRLHGAKVLTLALKCILQRHYHDRGVLRAPIIEAMGELVARFDEKRPVAMLAVCDEINFQRTLIEAKILGAQKGWNVRTSLVEILAPKFA